MLLISFQTDNPQFSFIKSYCFTLIKGVIRLYMSRAYTAKSERFFFFFNFSLLRNPWQLNKEEVTDYRSMRINGSYQRIIPSPHCYGIAFRQVTCLFIKHFG